MANIVRLSEPKSGRQIIKLMVIRVYCKKKNGILSHFDGNSLKYFKTVSELFFLHFKNNFDYLI